MNHCLIRLVVFALYNDDEETAERMLRRRKIYPQDSMVTDIDAQQWRNCVEFLIPYLRLPWFVPHWIGRYLPVSLYHLVSKLGFLFTTRLDALDKAYYARSAHGTASIDFIIHAVDDNALPDTAPPPLRRSCTGWYPTPCGDVTMTDTERDWLQTHAVPNSLTPLCASYQTLP